MDLGLSIFIRVELFKCSFLFTELFVLFCVFLVFMYFLWSQARLDLDMYRPQMIWF